MSERACRRCGGTRLREGDHRCYTCYNALQRERRRRSRETWEAHRDPDAVAPGYVVRGTSTLRGEDGAVKLVWQKTERDREDKLQQIIDAFDALPEKIRPAATIPPPSEVVDDLLYVYPMGDPHFGMYAWAPETGTDHDLDKARDQLLAAAARLISIAQPARHAVVLNLGDFFHANDSKARTPGHGHALDVDTRWPKVFECGVETLATVVELALGRHEKVTLRSEPGNHDPESAFALSVALHQRYRENPRVTVDRSPAKHWYHRFGRCLIGSTHGDTGRIADLPGVMAVDRPRDWGETEHRRWYVGHVHHESVKEGHGATVETFQTLAPSDAWHKGQGYRAGRSMRSDLWHREHGWQTRNVVGIGQVLEAINAAG